MKQGPRFKSLITGILLTLSAAPADAAEQVRRAWTVDGVAREALISVPEKAQTELTPVVFGFHGHGVP